MNDLTIAALVFVLVGPLLVVAYWLIRSAMRRKESRRDRLIQEECTSAATVPCAPDNEAGINLADADECALTYSLPEFDPANDPQWAAGRARLLDAIRDHRTNAPEGEQ